MATKKKKAPSKPAKRAAAKRAAASKKSRKAPAKARPAKKAVARRPAAAKKRAPRKAAAKAKPAKKASAPVGRAKALVRRQDRAGHLDPKYAAELRARGGRGSSDPASFVNRNRAKDDLVENLGEEFVGAATSGEYEAEDRQNQEVAEEVGGPFVTTTAGQEFADGTDPSNPKGSTREPFPRT